MEKLYIVSKSKPGANCGSDHQLHIVKFRLKLKKVGKMTWPFRYDLNQISYDYTVDMTNKIKELDLVDRMPEELLMEVHNIVQEVVIKNILKKRKRKERNTRRQSCWLRRSCKQPRKEGKQKSKEKGKDIPN